MGRNPSGDRLNRVRRSPNYRDGAFQNIEPTTMDVKPSKMPGLLWKFIRKPHGTQPPRDVPVIQADLKNLSADQPVIVWFGHSSYMISSKGFNVLVDPVFSGYASPLRGIGRAFKGADVYAVDDLPEIDLLIITHDHYDHLDFETIVKLKPKVKKTATSLGVGAHLEFWGYDKNALVKLDWWESASIRNDINITATPARHFSGRTLKHTQTLRSSFVLSLHGPNIFIGGDSGYSNQFKIIGDKFGPFDLALLDGAQYNDLWSLIHMMPEQTVSAAQDLNAKALLPVHWGKFAMAYHAWDEPIKRLVTAAQNSKLQIVTPSIGDVYRIGTTREYAAWWNMT